MLPERLSGFGVEYQHSELNFGFIWQQQGDEARLIHPTNGIINTTTEFCEQLESVAHGHTDRSALDDPLKQSLERVEEEGYITDAAVYKLTPPSQRSIWTVTAGFTGLLAVATAIGVFSISSGEISELSRLQFAIGIVFFGVTTYFHELGHKLACWPRFSPTLSLTLLHRFIPTATTRTNLAWLVSRRRRIIINFAGVGVDSALICLVGALGIATGHVSFAGILIGVVAIRLVASLNPLIETDAYWLLVDLLQQPNLRSHGRTQLSERQLTPASAYYACSLLMIGVFALVIGYQIITVIP